jgi:AhpD family alkylhydroperoxidase
MSRIPTPVSIDTTPAASRPLLEAVKQQHGSVPNLLRVVAISPAALQGYLEMRHALDKEALPLPTRERIALAVAEINGSSYCLSAHAYSGKDAAKLDDAEISANREGRSHTRRHRSSAIGDGGFLDGCAGPRRLDCDSCRKFTRRVRAGGPARSCATRTLDR